MEHERVDGDVPERLRALGRQPLDPAMRAAHRDRITRVTVGTEQRHRRWVWTGIAAAAVTGFLVGSTGLAMADSLPEPAQDVAHDVLGAVQVDVPAGKEGKRGPCVSQAARIKDKDAKRAAKEACPKGGGPDEDGSDEDSSDEPGTPGNGQDNHEGDPCHGRPPWAGPMSKEERAAAKAASSRADCPDDDEQADDEEEEGVDDQP